MDFIEIMAEGESAILLFNPLIFIRLIDQPSFYPTFHPTFYFLSSGTGSLLTLDQSSACTKTSRAFAAGAAVHRMRLKGRALLVSWRLHDVSRPGARALLSVAELD